MHCEDPCQVSSFWCFDSTANPLRAVGSLKLGCGGSPLLKLAVHACSKVEYDPNSSSPCHGFCQKWRGPTLTSDAVSARSRRSQASPGHWIARSTPSTSSLLKLCRIRSQLFYIAHSILRARIYVVGRKSQGACINYKEAQFSIQDFRAYLRMCVCVSLSLPLRVSAGQPQLLFLAFQDPGPELLVEPQVVFVNQFKC